MFWSWNSFLTDCSEGPEASRITALGTLLKCLNFWATVLKNHLLPVDEFSI